MHTQFAFAHGPAAGSGGGGGGGVSATAAYFTSVLELLPVPAPADETGGGGAASRYNKVRAATRKQRRATVRATRNRHSRCGASHSRALSPLPFLSS